MFSNKEDGWAKTAEMHKGGPKKKIEVQQEVENKYKAEERARNGGQGGRGYGNDRNDRRDGGGGYNNNDRDRGDRKQGGGGSYGYDRDRNAGGGGKQETNRYQKKDTQGGGGTYGKGGRENRNERRPTNIKESDKVITKEIVEIDDEEMGQLLKKNFEQYASKMSLDADEPG
jgi:hypothetical protein